MSNKRKASFPARLEQSGQDVDTAFFLAHPTTTSYHRPATAQELHIAGLPPGTVVYVQRVGRQRIRAFVAPDERTN